MSSADFWIDRLQLKQHPEGGWYRETYRSADKHHFAAGNPFDPSRSWVTSIFYLLRQGDRSRLHRIMSDELWFFHTGDPLTVHIFPREGTPGCFTLGTDPDKGQQLEECAPAGFWFGAEQNGEGTNGFSLVSCVVAPGFEFGDLAFAEKTALLRQFPSHAAIIERLC